MKKRGWICFIYLIACISSCSQKNIETECQNLPAVFDYYDSVTFDNKLSEILHCKEKQVTLKMPTQLRTSQIPSRLDRWLAAVDETGGEVNVAQDPMVGATKGFFSVGIILDAIDIAKSTYKYLQDKKLYSSTENYDVYIYYRSGIGDITRIVFVEKNIK